MNIAWGEWDPGRYNLRNFSIPSRVIVTVIVVVIVIVIVIVIGIVIGIVIVIVIVIVGASNVG